MVQNVVIIGAGPAGLLLAHYLLRRGNYHIDIYERRPDPRLADVSKDRTFPISLQERGRKAIRAIVGLEEAIAAQSTFCQGTIFTDAERLSKLFALLTLALCWAMRTGLWLHQWQRV